MNILLLAMQTGNLSQMQRAIDLYQDISRDNLKDLLVDLVYLISECHDKELHDNYRDWIYEKFTELENQ